MPSIEENPINSILEEPSLQELNDLRARIKEFEQRIKEANNQFDQWDKESFSELETELDRALQLWGKYLREKTATVNHKFNRTSHFMNCLNTSKDPQTIIHWIDKLKMDHPPVTIGEFKASDSVDEIANFYHIPIGDDTATAVLKHIGFTKF